MTRSTVTSAALALGALAFTACSPGDAGDEADAPPPADAAAAPAPSGSPGAGSGEISRSDFVLCPAIEPIAGDLTSLAGFELDASREIEAGAGECRLRGDGGAFVVVALALAAVPSLGEYVSGFRGTARPASGLGEGAVVIPDPAQPHAVFPLRGQIVDVGMENFSDPPDDAAVLEAARRVREALSDANGG